MSQYFVFSVYAYLVHFCSTLAPPPHGKITCYLGDDGKPNPGDSCDVQCNDGYDQIGGLSRTCTVDGIWNGRETVCIKRGELSKYTVYVK